VSDPADQTKDDKPARTSQPKIVQLPEFGPRYRVIGAIGKGGMGEVFRAYDTELKGEVALKVIRGDADHEGALARFRREIALARKVTSPNVLRVYDLAEHDGLRFLTMEYVDGEDLAALMRREARLPIERAVSIFRQVCQGLEAAHAEGVVHRDLKPQNVLVDTEGRVRVADFGLARSIAESGLTASGAIMGSPAYMSPEQVKGDPTDERSDIYSLGIMLYQLVAGETPFQAPTPHAVMEMRLHKRPALLRDVRPDAPAHLEGICAKCLALAPSSRFQSIAEVLAILEMPTAITHHKRPRWLVPLLVAAIAAVAAVAAMVAWPRSHRAEPPPTAPVAAQPVPATAPPIDRPITVLIFAFTNHTTDPVFENTLDEVLDDALRRSSRLDPVAGVDLRALANVLGADIPLDADLGKKLAARDDATILVVHGTITPKGSGFTIAIEATNARTGKSVLSTSEAAPTLDGVVPALGRLASALRQVYGETISEGERDATGLSPSIDADHEYAIGTQHADSGNYEASIEHLQRAVAKDPGFALAHSTLSVSYSNAGRPTESKQERQLALKAVDQMSERDRLKLLADYYNFTTEDHERAIPMYEQLLAKWPADHTWSSLALGYLMLGNTKKALAAAQKDAQYHPREALPRVNLPEYELLAGDFERSAGDMRKALEDFSRQDVTWHLYLVAAEALGGHRDRALEALAVADKFGPSRAALARADLALAEGRTREAIDLLDKGIRADDAKHESDAAVVKLSALAEAKLLRGDKAGARAAAAKAAGDPGYVLIASLVQLAAGDDAAPRAAAAKAAEDPAPSRRAIGKLIEAETLRLHGKPMPAMVAAQDAIKLVNTAYAHYLLARAALDAKRFPEAYAELQTCITRRGELAMSADDQPGLRHIPVLTYYLAKAQEGMGNPEAAAKSYAAFLAMQHDPDADDPLVVDARKHVQ
jgi:tetratricopeptide (TPR) repeat protein/predicted Ser/Thr protein kinase